MTVQELRERDIIYIEKINRAFDQYDHVKLSMDEKKAMTHFKNLRQEYGTEHSFVDFYYFRLEDESREMVEEALTPADCSYLESLAMTIRDPEEDIVFPLDDNLLRIVCRLNAAEILFSTIYFETGRTDRPRTTWWGNYEKEYICFKDKTK
ncbi:MAG: hypothetical protein PUB22_05235 [Clostridiales bacterium]|nr:hypothetical protein [Clostridiales bacterium]